MALKWWALNVCDTSLAPSFLTNKMKGAGMTIFKEKAGVISKEPVWVCIHEEYMYLADTFWELLHILGTEWEHDKHLVG